MAEVLVTMLGAGVVSFPWEKPNLALNEILELDRPTYYSAVEVKGIGLQGNKIRGSRATGLLLTDDAVTTVYNIGSTEEVRWDYRAEMRLKAFAQIELMQNRLALPYQDEQLRAIVFAADMRQLAVLMDNTRQLKSGFFAFSGDYQHFHFLTNDRKGETILRLLCDSGRKSVLDGVLSEDLAPAVPDWQAENDGFTADGLPVLFGYTCDMPRIRRFDNALDTHGLRGTLICFDFQEQALRKVCGDRITLQSLDFEAVEALLKEQE